MKRLTIFVIILAGFAIVCPGQHESGVLPTKTVQLSEPRLTGPVRHWPGDEACGDLAANSLTLCRLANWPGLARA